MTTAREQREIRLKNDYREMCNIRGPIIQWRAVAGRPPFVDAYDLVVSVRSIVGRGPQYRGQHSVAVRLPSNYPADSAPEIRMTSTPLPFHPNWYVSGLWCPGANTSSHEGLGRHVVRMVRTLQFDLEITNPGSAANTAARDWFRANLRTGLFPCDDQQLPDPTTSSFDSPLGKKFQIGSPARASTFRIEGD
jgi:ubiquitin-protein ligase